LAAEIGVGEYDPLLQVRAEMPWIGFALCAACGRQQSVRRFARLGESLGRHACGGELPAGPLGMRSVLPAADLRAVWEQPLEELGLADGGAIGISTGEAWTWFFLGAMGSPYQPEASARPEYGLPR
jgi:hypothetical protein